jgi:hypothetical protein
MLTMSRCALIVVDQARLLLASGRPVGSWHAMMLALHADGGLWVRVLPWELLVVAAGLLLIVALTVLALIGRL